jgi:hypothetical protein
MWVVGGGEREVRFIEQSYETTSGREKKLTGNAPLATPATHTTANKSVPLAGIQR